MCEQIYIGVKCRELHARNVPHSPALVWFALVHLLDLDDVGIAEVPLLADHVGLADARQESLDSNCQESSKSTRSSLEARV